MILWKIALGAKVETGSTTETQISRPRPKVARVNPEGSGIQACRADCPNA